MGHAHRAQSGVLRVYGANLRQVLRRSVGNRGTSFAAGVGVTGLLQSSTATALLASSFVSQGMITTSAALAVMLGADVGTALMVQFFSLNLAWLAPLLIVAGVVVYLSKKNERAGQIGKIVLGLGVMILALQMVTAATAPLTQAAGVRVSVRTALGRPAARRADRRAAGRRFVFEPRGRAAGCHAGGDPRGADRSRAADRARRQSRQRTCWPC